MPGRADLWLDFLLLDVNGTLTERGRLIDGVLGRIDELRSVLEIRLLSADTFGTLDDVARQLDGLPVDRIVSGEDKAALAAKLGAKHCVAIGNGANDELMLRTVALGFVVLGREGASPRTIAAADVVTPSIADALDLLREPNALTATLRS